ncbi:MAG: 1-aminocyclopropane-1-carboxylate deaminase/D-cysteine desulfhydrase [Bacteroidota bacterium]|nr:1-aminocyclopropane-1-carboxylate deaminase/D-cysteine desulfhydrase [Bacteroidota bacterium]
MEPVANQFQGYTPGPVQSVSTDWSDGRVSMLRLDLLQSWASGNKYYKLKYTLEEAYRRSVHTVVSKGGMFSNHLYALSEACNTFGFKCVCIIRSYGEDPANPTLQCLRNNKCDLIFLDPSAYDVFNEFDAERVSPGSSFIPEGGESKSAIRGATEILQSIDQRDVNHIIISGGTMTTAAGLLQSADENIQLSIVPAWKGCTVDFVNNILEKYEIVPRCSWTLWPDFHFGGFAKSNKLLVSFMQSFTRATIIPLDPVYTAKMMYGICEKMKLGFFDKNDKILAIHTGGLQGLEGAYYKNPDLFANYIGLVKGFI